jgi:tetratricopeptide (TPR) repeat protein
MGDSFHPSLSDLPTPIAFVLDEFLRAPDAFRALWRMVDAAEIITRFFAITVLSDLLRQRGEFPEPVRNVLTENLEHPTFGAWRELLAVAVDNLPRGKEGARCFVAELPSFVRDRWLPALGGGEDPPEEKLIALRNLLAHAGRLPDVQARKLREAHRKRFEALIGGMAFLTEYDLVACDREACDREEGILRLKGLPDPGQAFPKFKGHLSFAPQPERVYLVRGGEGLDLFPLHAFTDILQWRGDGFESLEEAAPQIYFRVSRKGYLEYISFSDRAAFSHLGEEAYQRFQEIFRLEEWRARQRQEEEARGVQRQWEELVRELTEVLVGREEHIRQVKEAIKGTGKGFLWISGKPGIGKSALMAKLMKDYVGQTQRYIVIPYFFRLGQPGCSTMEFLSAALKRLQAELHRTIEPAPRLPDRQRQWAEALEEAARTGKKVLFLVDGLDEIYRQEREFIELPFMALREGIVWVCAGRSERELEEALQRRGARWVFPEGLPPLGADAIRTMLTEHLGRLKYELFERDEGDRNRFVEAVARKSEGLPLYVRMLVEDLKARQWTVWDEGKLPQGLAAYYERLLERLRASDAGTVLTPLFCLLAWAKDPIPEGALKFLLRVHHLAGSARWDEWFRRALESGHLMLQRRSTPDGEAGWTIYHDSFRQHLLESEAVSGNREWAQRRWVDVGEDREALASQEPSLHRYILRHYAEHLYEAGEGSALFRLALDPAFAKDQARHLPDEPHLPLKAVRLALEMAIRSEDAPRMARLLIEHARRAGGEETPLQAWRRGHRERALRMATEILFERDPRLGTLWSLLLAWVAESEGEGEWARRILEAARKRWEGGKLEKLEDWQGELAAFWLGELGAVEGAAEAAGLMLDDAHKGKVAAGWASRGLFDRALNVAEGIQEARERAEALMAIAEAMARTGMTQQAQEAFHRALRTAEAIEVAGERAEALGAIAEAMARAGMWEQALQTAKAIEEAGERAEALGAIAEAMARTGMTQQAQEVFHQALQTAKAIQGAWERAKALGAIAKAMASAGMTQQAQEVFHQALQTAEAIKGAGERAWTLGAIAEAMARAGMWEQALQTAGAIEGAEERAEALGAIAEAMASTGMTQQALWEQALQTAGAIEGAEERAEALGAIAEAMASTGMTQQAQEAFHQALRTAEAIERARKRALALGAIAEAMARTGMTQQAQEAFHQALRTAEAIEEAWERAEALRAIAEALASAGMWEQALQTAEAIEEAWERAWALGAIAEALASAGMWEQALRTAEAIKGAGERAWALRAIAEALASAGMWDQALQTAEAIEEAWERAEALRAIAEAMASAGMWERALRTAGAMEGAEERAEALGAIAKAMASTGITQQALWEQALWTAGAMEGAEERAWALGAIAEALASAGMWEQALQTAEAIEEAWERAWALGAIAEALASAGMWEQALRTAEAIEEAWRRTSALRAIAEALARAGMTQQALWEQALRTAEAIERARERAEALGAIAEALARAGMTQQAQEAFHQALQTAKAIQGAWERAEALGAIAEAMARAGMTQQALWEQALQTAEAIEEAWRRTSALGAIAEAMARTGMTQQALWEQALQTAKAIEEAGERASALRAIAEAMARAGMTQQAQEAFYRALRTAEAIEGAWKRASALGAIAEAMARTGMTQQAQEAFYQALRTAEAIERARERASALRAIAEAMARAGMTQQAQEAFYQALRTAEAIEGARERAEALGAIAEAMARAGMTQQAQEAFYQALRTAEAIEEAGERAWALMAIAEAMARTGMTQQAQEAFYQALRTAEAIERARERASALRAIAEAMARAGMTQQAQEAFYQALRTAEAIEGARERAEALGAIAEAMARAGMTQQAQEAFHQALRTAEAIEEAGERAWALRAIAEAMARIGEAEGAAGIMEREIGAREQGLLAVLQALTERAREGDEKSKRGFLRLLPLCGWSLELAYSACGLLAGLYPEQAEGIARVVMEMKP